MTFLTNERMFCMTKHQRAHERRFQTTRRHTRRSRCVELIRSDPSKARAQMQTVFIQVAPPFAKRDRATYVVL